MAQEEFDHDCAKKWLSGALGLEHPNEPFPWQMRLLQRFMDNEIDRALDLPTGLGKTAVIAIWLVARALGAHVPRRLVYVVDRRAVVDQATRTAEDVRVWVQGHADVTSALGLDTPPRALPISTLRGQFVDNREWLDDPSLPAIVVGTVDMVGSRLLFEGYGTTRKMRPYQAGLLGSDTLFVLDEAHLVPPFEHLIESIVGERGKIFRPLGDARAIIPPVRLLSLSATGRHHGSDAFELEDDDYAHPVVEQRLTGRKRLVVAPMSATKDLPGAMTARAWELAVQSTAPVRVLVFTSRREHAEKAKKELNALAQGAGTNAETELFVGGRRVHERVAAAERLTSLGFLAGSDRERASHVFLFATSAGEVGVDLDADHAVMDVVAWERTIQRLGRVNRRGKGDAEVHVMPTDEVGSEQREAVLALLDALPTRSDGGKDASPTGLRTVQTATRTNEKLAELARKASTPELLRPALSRPLVDAWAMTSLREHAGRPEVGPWLRGWDDPRPQTSIVWRGRLREVTEVGLEQYLEATPPHLSERLETETHRAVDWLLAVAKRCQSQYEGTIAVALDGAGEIVERLELGHRWLKDPKWKKEALRQLGGKTLIVDAALGGLSDDGLLDPSVKEPALAADNAPPWSRGEQSASDNDEANDGRLPFRVRKCPADYEPAQTGGWRECLRLPLTHSEDEQVTCWLVVDRWKQDPGGEDSRSMSPRRQSLVDHQTCAAKHAVELAERLQLPAPIASVLRIAARLHDEGKRAHRWQQAFRAPVHGGPYAKTAGPVNVRALNGYRHEFGSLPWAEQDAEVQALPEGQRDLVLHLIAAHHGFARPVIGTGGCEEAPSVLQARARAVALRFARMSKVWGPWGLAYLEALLRAADQQASRTNDEGGVA